MAKDSKATEKTEEKATSLKQHYAEMFAKEKEKQTGEKYKGNPSIEESNGHPLLVKYAQNYLNTCD